MVRPSCFFIAEDNDRGAVCQFTAGMNPEKALMSGAIPIFIYLDIGFVTLGIPVTHKQLCHKFIDLFTDFRYKCAYPVYDGLFGQGDALHPVIQCLSVKRQAQCKLPVKDVCYNGAGYGAFVDQGVPVWDGKQVMFQAYRNNRRINHLCIVRRIQLHELFVLVPVGDSPVVFAILFIQRVYIQVIYDLPGQFPKGISQAGVLFCMPAPGALPALMAFKINHPGPAFLRGAGILRCVLIYRFFLRIVQSVKQGGEAFRLAAEDRFCPQGIFLDLFFQEFL